MPVLSTNIRTLGGIYKRYATSLEKLGILKLEDFLYHIPFRYDDFTLISKIEQVKPGEIVTIRGNVLEIKNQYTRRRFTIQKAKVKDESGAIDIVWFNQPYIVKNLKEGDSLSLSGKIEEKENEEYLPSDILNRNGLQNLFDAIYKVHFPKSLEEVRIARKRLSFDELFLLQTSSLQRRKEWEKNLKGFVFNIKKYSGQIQEFVKKLPFELTSAQKKATSEIFSDFSMEKPMNRLLEGDVGSGKTVVATAAMYLAYLNGFQSVLMAPTEISQIHCCGCN